MEDKSLNRSILRYLVEMKTEISAIKTDIISINKNIEEIKKENDLILSAFPNGVDDHIDYHKKKKKRFIFF